MVRSFVVALVIVSLASGASGCIYMRESVQPTSRAKGSYEHYPTTLEANEQRRAKRRKYALIAAPIEVALGALLVAGAVYAKSSPSTSDTTTGVLADAGKDILGRLLIALIGSSIVVSGVGDGVLG